jgi:hypothetical protein
LIFPQIKLLRRKTELLCETRQFAFDKIKAVLTIASSL